jgi:DNA-binding NarL/FixJ family response regulator
MTRILLADDHDVVRQGLRKILESHPGWEVCGEASNGREAVKLALALKPEIAVLDLSMPELNGLEATRQIKKAQPETEILIFTMHDDEDLIRDVLVAGARGFVLKSDVGKQLMEAVGALSRHKTFFTPKASEALLDNLLIAVNGSRKESLLTSREREILQLLAEGWGNKEVAALLCISIKTVETHRTTIMRKVGINSVVQLVHYAIRNRMVEA